MSIDRRRVARVCTRVLRLFVAILLPLVLASPAMAATYIVTTTNDEVDAGACALNSFGAVSTDSDCSLREAIIAANAHSNSLNSNSANDTIQLTGGTVYQLTLSGANEDASATGDLDITENVTIGTEFGATNPAIIQAGGSAGSGIDRVLDINPANTSSVSVFFHHLHIRYGKVAGSGGGIRFQGGGAAATSSIIAQYLSVYDNQATVSGGGLFFKDLANVNIIVGNENGSPSAEGIARNIVTAGNGGGIYLDNSPWAAIFGNTAKNVEANEASGNGGGAYVINSGTKSVVFLGDWLGNKADRDNNNSGDGGALYVAAGSTVSFAPGNAGSASKPNSAINGGAVANFGTVDMTGSTSNTFSSNTAKVHGGAVYNSGTFTLTKGSFQYNAADSDNNNTGDGGAFYNATGTASISSSVVATTSAPPLNVTFQNNTARNGGAVAVAGGTATVSTLQMLSNSATAQGGGAFISGGTLTMCEIYFYNGGATTSGGAFAKTGGTLNVKLSWIAANNNGGPTAVASAGTTPTLENNWWNCDGFPVLDGSANPLNCATFTGTIDADPRIDLRALVSPGTVAPNGSSVVTADVSQNTNGQSFTACNATGPGPVVLQNSQVTFANDTVSIGSFNNTLVNFDANGEAQSTWTSNGTTGTQPISVSAAGGTQSGAIVVASNPTKIDLSLSKSVDNGAPQVGTNVTFTVSVRNAAGFGTATNVVVNDLLDSSAFTFVSALPSQGSYNSTTGDWTVGTVNPGASDLTLQIVATVKNTGTLSNTAQVSFATQPDNDSTPANDDAAEDDQATITVTPLQADLSVTMSMNPSGNLGLNNESTFTITVTNAGSPDSTADANPTLKAVFSSGISYVSDSPTQGSYDSSTGIWTVGTLPVGASATLTVVEKVTDISTFAKSANAQVFTSDQDDPDSTPNDGTGDDYAAVFFSAQAQQADLSLTKTVNFSTPSVGQGVTFTITLSNAGPHSATNVDVTDLLPSGLTYVTSNPSQGTYDSSTGVWDVGTVTTSGATMTITATVTSKTAVTNTASVTASDALDNTPASASATVTPKKADLSLTQSASVLTQVAGSDVTFTITLTNPAAVAGQTGSATNVSVEDLLGSGLTYASHTVTRGSYDSTTGIWSVGTLFNNQTATLTLTATMQASGTTTNIVEVSAADQADPDSTPDNGVSTEDDYARLTITRQSSNTFCADENIIINSVNGGGSPCDSIAALVPGVTTKIAGDMTALAAATVPTASTPYPSEMYVSGVTPNTLTSLTVSIRGLKHPRPDDLDIMLVAPDGTTRAMIWSDAGGRNPIVATNGINVTLADSAASSLPDESDLADNATYKPADYDAASICDSGDDFPAPAPAAVDNSTLTASGGVFNGIDPNGTWKLYIVDDEEDEIDASGVVFDGWCLTIVTNNPPDAVDDNLTVAEDSGATVVNVLTNDTDPENDTRTITSASPAASKGTVSCTASSCTYTPNANEFGSDSFTYTIQDSFGGTDSATVHVTITEINDAPVAADDSKTTPEDAPLSFAASTLTTNDSKGAANESAQTLTVTNVGNPTHGTVSLISGTITFTPDADYNGAASFEYTVTDDGTTNGGADPKTSTATVNVTVTEVNDAPVAADDARSTAEDTPLIVTASTLATNDSKGPANESSQTLTVTAVSNPVNGTVSLNIGSITFTPDANFHGTASFDYTVTDDGTTNGSADAKSDTGTVTVTVTEVNDAPVATDDTKSTAEDAPLTFTASDLVANDTKGAANESSQTLTVTAVSNPVNGTVSLDAGSITFTPDANFNGTATFDYTVTDDGTTDGAADPKSDTGSVTVTVTEVNDAPTANADSVATAEDTPLTFAASTLTTNDSKGPANESSQTLTVTAVSNPVNGTVSLNAGSITFTPDANFNGTASFDYTVTDDGTTNGSADPLTSTATVTVNVSEVNDAPAASADSKSTAEDTPLSFPATDLTANDNAGEASQTATVSSVGNPVNGTVSLDAGTITFTPDANFNGTASFDYTITDDGTTAGAADPKTSTATVTVTVTEVNDAPVASADTTSTPEDAALTFAASTLLTNDGKGAANESSQTITVTSVGNPVNGTVSLNAGSITFTPNANFNGSASFDYTITDDGTTNGSADPKTSSATVTVTVTEINDAPVASADTKNATEDTPLVFSASDLTANDDKGAANESSQTLTVTGVSNPQNGTVSLAAGTITFTPNADFHGTASFDYAVSDDGTTNGAADPKSSSSTVTISVAEVNDAPVATDDAGSTNEDTPFVVSGSTLTANDSKGPANESAQTLTVTGVSNPVNGTVALNAGTVTFTPDANFNGTASFDYTVTDDGTTNGAADPKSDTGTVTVSVKAINDPPVANDDNKSTPEETPLTFPAADLTANDSAGPADESSQTLTVTAVSNPQHGTVSLLAGNITFTPDANFSGAASFTYTLADDGAGSDGDGMTSTATVHVTVTEVNDPPTASADAKTSAEDTPLTFPATDLTANDSAGDPSQTVTVTSVTNPANGTVSLVAGNITFTPDANFNGMATFDYTITDDGTTNGSADPLTATATVTITVSEANDAPSATADSTSTAEDAPITIAASTLVANDSKGPANESSQTLTITSVGNAVNGTVALNGGNVTFTPDANFNGTATFDYTVTDDGTTSGAADPKTSSATVTVTVTEVNDAPVANADAKSAVEDTPLTFAASDLTANDGTGAANEPQTLTVTSVGSAVNGTVSLNAGNITFTPDANFNGAASFQYTVTDNGTTSGAADPKSAVATVTVTVSEVNDAPTAVGDSATTAEDTQLTIAASTLLANDSRGPANESAQTLSITSVGSATNGSVALVSGSVVFTPAANYHGPASFQYTITDGGTTGGAADPKSSTASVSLTITEVNDAPIAGADARTTGEDVPLTFAASTLLANDNAGAPDESAQTLTVISVGNAVNGAVALNAGNITFTPDTDFSGDASFTYTVQDNGTTNGASDPKTTTATVLVTVNAANDTPVAQNDSYSGTEDAPLHVAAPQGVLANDSDVDGDPLRAFISSQPAHGNVTLEQDGSFTYVPDPNFNGTDSFTYVADDNQVSSSPARVTITIGAVDDAPSATVSGDATVCSGTPATITATLTGTAPWTIRWSDGVTQNAPASTATRTVTPLATTVYTIVSVTDATAAAGTTSGSATITVLSAPQPAITGPSSVVLGAPVTLTATPGFDSYQWFHDGNAVSGVNVNILTISSLTAEDLGRYTVRVTANGCAGDSAAFLVTLSNEAVLPVVGQTAGANGANFRTVLVLSNPTDLEGGAKAAAEMSGEVRFFREGALLGAYPYTLAPGATRYVTDFLPAGFTGLATASAVPTRGALPLILAHVFDDQGVNGTSGLIERAIRTGDAARSGERVVLIAPSDPAVTRFNVGVRALADGLSFRLTARDASGAVLTTIDRSYGANAFEQITAEQLTGRAPGANETLTFEILSGNGVIYGASTDNRTNDPNMQIAARAEASSAAASPYVIAVAGSTRGAFDSNFKTAVQLHNPSNAPMTATFVYHRAGSAGSPDDPSSSVTVAPHATFAIDDILPRLGESGIGTIDLVVTSAVKPVAVVRVFNDSTKGQTSMTEELLQPSDAVSKGQRASVIASHLPSRARFNIGVRTLGNGARIRAIVQDREGNVLRTTELEYEPRFLTHANAGDLLGFTFTGDERVTFEVLEGEAFFYGVWTDNVTQDPSFHFAMKP
ncbi:MAG TPA: Ig-like domain-containing protein [Thermoanaerobaculia bacterium]|jgi:uncharacterized repeat protein (TIGR01451 family)/CSLREA domain-containing protein